MRVPGRVSYTQVLVVHTAACPRSVQGRPGTCHASYVRPGMSLGAQPAAATARGRQKRSPESDVPPLGSWLLRGRPADPGRTAPSALTMPEPPADADPGRAPHCGALEGLWLPKEVPLPRLPKGVSPDALEPLLGEPSPVAGHGGVGPCAPVPRCPHAACRPASLSASLQARLKFADRTCGSCKGAAGHGA